MFTEFVADLTVFWADLRSATFIRDTKNFTEPLKQLDQNVVQNLKQKERNLYEAFSKLGQCRNLMVMLHGEEVAGDIDQF